MVRRAADVQMNDITRTRPPDPPAGGAGPSPGHVSLEGMHRTVTVPHHEAGFWQNWRAFRGPALLGSGGYMDPGHLGTDLQGGGPVKYGPLWGGGLASLVAMFMQDLAVPPVVAHGQ